MPFEEFIAAGLYDPDAERAEERRELLQHLVDRGFTPAQICAAAAKGGPVTDLAAFLTGKSEGRLGLEDMAEKLGAPIAEVEEALAALGIPVMSGDDDISASFLQDFELFRLGVGAYGRERTLEFARVIGASVAALMEAAREMATAPYRGKELTELELSEANEFGMAAWREIPSLVGHVMIERARRDIWFEQELLRGDVMMAVSFVDLVDSTPWTASLAPDAHADAIASFEHTANMLAIRSGCRVVKFLGDEAMIVGADPASVAEVAARLCAAVTLEESLPTARGAVGWGQVTPRSGDYFGDVVNLAARAVKYASAGTIVVTEDVASKLDLASWQLGAPQVVALRGIADDVVLVEATLV